MIAPLGAVTLTSDHAGGNNSKLIAIFVDDESMRDSPQDLIEAAGSTHIALDLEEFLTNPGCIVKLLA